MPWRGGRARVIGLVPGEIVTASLVDELAASTTASPWQTRAATWRRSPCWSGTSEPGGKASASSAASASGAARSAPRSPTTRTTSSSSASTTVRWPLAVNRLRELGGGIVVADEHEVRAELPLPVAGLLSDRPLDEVLDASRAINAAAVELGVTCQAPFQILAFLALSVIPALKITDRGLVDVDRREIVPLAVDAPISAPRPTAVHA